MAAHVMLYEAWKKEFQQNEDKDGIRFTWNTWPYNGFEAEHLAVPLACLYTPLKEILELPLIQDEPLMCSNETCHAVLNPFCKVDYQLKVWVCNFCFKHNQFPLMSEEKNPAEIAHSFSTIEYRITQPCVPCIFLFVLDMCIKEEELVDLKKYFQTLPSLLPSNAVIGFITFGQMVQVHGWACKDTIVFSGTEDVTGKEIQDMLGIGKCAQFQQPESSQQAREPVCQTEHAGNKFLQPIHKCRMILTDLLEGLRRDPWPVLERKRPMRSTGIALSIAVELLKCTYPTTGVRIMLFVGGPCTQGPGIVVRDELKSNYSHYDFQKDSAKCAKQEVEYYKNLADRAAANGHIVDIYSGALDQVGLHKMKYLPDFTGGDIIMVNSFTSVSFKTTFRSLFLRNSAGELRMAFDAVLEVKTSRGLKVSGAIGSCISLYSKSDCVSEREVGIGGTSQWKFCGIHPSNTVGIFFEIENQHNASIAQGDRGCIQFITRYQHYSGEKRIRVTTVAKNWADASTDMHYISAGFDQEAAAVLMARLACFGVERVSRTDVLLWLDRILVTLCQKFGKYDKNDVSSLQFSDNFLLYPQLMYHLRRSQFLQVFNNNPDEISYHRLLLNRENVANSLIMIQPKMYAYSFQYLSKPVLLDVSNMEPGQILLVDTFFHIFIFFGAAFELFRENYQNSSSYKKVVQTPYEDALVILRNRFPTPRFVDSHQGTSQAFKQWTKAGYPNLPKSRIDQLHEHLLRVQVAPEILQMKYFMPWCIDYDQQESQESVGALLPVDAANLEMFMDHLRKLIVSSSPEKQDKE